MGISDTRSGSQRGDDVEFDEVVVDGGAGAEFESVTNFVAEGVESVGGAEAGRTALHAFTFSDKSVAAGFYSDIESHSVWDFKA